MFPRKSFMVMTSFITQPILRMSAEEDWEDSEADGTEEETGLGSETDDLDFDDD